MAIELTPETPDPNETPKEEQGSEFDRWEAERNAELRGEEPPKPAKDEPKPSEAPAAPKAGEPEKAETAGDTDPPEKKKEQDAEPKGDDDPDKAESGKKPGKTGFQRRIDRLTREKREGEDRERKLEARLTNLEGNKPAGEKPAGDKPGQDPEPKAEADEGKPKPEDFDDYESYTDALFDWKADHRDQVAAEAEQRTRDKELQRTAFDNWTKRLDASREVHDDFDEVTEADIPLTPAMQQAMLDSEQGAELAYWLGTNPKEAERIAGLSPVATIRELGRIEATFATAETTKKPDDPAPKRKTVSKAPAPVKPIPGGGSHATDLHDPKMPFSDWEKQRNAELVAGQR